MRDLPGPLSPREREVWALIAEGLSNRAIAHCIGAAYKTVEEHCYVLYDKLGLRNQPGVDRRVKAAAMFWRNGTAP